MSKIYRSESSATDASGSVVVVSYIGMVERFLVYLHKRISDFIVTRLTAVSARR